MKRVWKSNSLRLPRKIEGIDGDAVSAQAGAGIERLEAERLALGGFDHLPDVDAHAQAEQLELVDQRDVHAAVNVLQQLGHLRHGRRRDGDGAVEDGAVKLPAEFAGARIEPADDLGNVAARDRVVAGIFALGREDNVEEVRAISARPRGFQAFLVLALQDGNQDFFRGAGIGRALQNHQLSGAQMGRNRLRGLANVAEIGLVMFVQRRGDADDDGVHTRDVGVVGGGGETIGARGLNIGGSDAIDVGAARLKHVHFLLVDVEASHGK